MAASSLDEQSSKLHESNILLKRAENAFPEEAVCLYAEAIKIKQQYNDETYHRAYIGYANALVKCGRPYEALQYYTKVLEDRYVNDRVLLQRVLIPMTNIMLDMGQYAEVEKTLQLYMMCVTSGQYPALLSNYASALAFQGRFNEALTMLSELLGSENTAIRGIILQNMGYISMDAKCFDDALLYLRDALPYFSGNAKAIVQSNYALALAHCNQIPEALENINSAITKLKHSANNDYIRALRKKAEILLIRGNKHEALNAFHQFFIEEKGWLLSHLPTMTNQQRLDVWSRENDLLAECFLLENDAADFLMDVALFRRQTSLLGQQCANVPNISSSGLRKYLDNGEAAVEFVRYNDIDDPDCDIYGAIILSKKGKTTFVRLFDKSSILQSGTVLGSSLEQAIKGDSWSLINALYSDSIWSNKVWQPILDALPNNTRHVYFAPDGLIHLWGIENMPIPQQYGAVQLHRLSTLTLLTERNECTNTKHSDRKALVLGGLDYDDNVIDTLQSASSNHEALNYIRQQVGGYDHPFTYLKGTMLEADSVASTLHNATVRHEMGEQELKCLLNKYSLVHMATHGYNLNFGIRKRQEIISDSIPIDISLLGSGVALSGANNSENLLGEDNLLSAREICDLNLSNVDFVILSACQTAQGSIFDEGVAGLIRGLKNAGVGTIVATLWSIDDMATVYFMDELYTQLENGVSKYDAYRLAQQKLQTTPIAKYYSKFSASTLAKNRKKTVHYFDYSAPYYWAPFIIIDAIN
jgi:CHAT domain-containing protein